MIDPKVSSATPISSQIALSAALFLSGLFGLVAGIALPPVKAVANEPKVLIAQPEPLVHTGFTVEPDELIQFCSKHAKGNRSFVLFRGGTCVVVTEPSADPVAEAIRSLRRCSEEDAHFVAEMTEDEDAIMAFNDPVFHLFSLSDLSGLSDSPDGAVAAPPDLEQERILDGFLSPQSKEKARLLARQRLLDDASNSVPLSIIRSERAATVAR